MFQSERITENADYEGIRIRFRGTLGTARIHMQLDIGFGDIVFPGPEELELPSLLNFSTLYLLGYSRESAIAEKFEAMVKLEVLNSRMKDFYDIWLLSRQFDFEGDDLAEAVRLTFKTRKTELAANIVAFEDDFIEVKKVQWDAFRRRMQQVNVPESFNEVVRAIDVFLAHPISLIHRNSTSKSWIAPGPWS